MQLKLFSCSQFRYWDGAHCVFCSVYIHTSASINKKSNLNLHARPDLLLPILIVEHLCSPASYDNVNFSFREPLPHLRGRFKLVPSLPGAL